MLKVLIILLVVGLGALLFSTMGSQPPLRGLTRLPGSAQQILLARARPCVTFTIDPSLGLLTAGWCDVHPATMDSVDGDAKMWLALYQHDKGLLVTAVADGMDRWEWESGGHAAFKPLRSQQLPGGGIFSIFETVTMLEHRRDPFCGAAPTGRATKESGACLVYRAKMILEFDKTQVIVEYHEDLPGELAPDIAFMDDYLNAFTRRARKAGQIRVIDKEEAGSLAEGIGKMGTLDKGISRRALAVWTGRMHRKGHL